MDPEHQENCFLIATKAFGSDPLETRAAIRVFWTSIFAFSLHCRRWRRRIVAQSKRAQAVPRHQLLTVSKSSITRRKFVSSNKKTTRFRSVLYLLYSVYNFWFSRSLFVFFSVRLVARNFRKRIGSDLVEC